MSSSSGAKPKFQEKRKVSVPVVGTDHKKSIEALKQEFKRKMSLPEYTSETTVFDPTAKAHNSFSKKRGYTGVVYDDKMYDHFCPWDQDYPENPERLKAVIKRCNELGLLERCHRLPSRGATKEELQLIHSENVVNLLESLENASEDKLKEVSCNNDSIYINKCTYSAARTAAGCTLEATKAVVDGSVHNAVALVRPPGHHAMENDYCGYSFFNNVAIAAKYSVDELNVKKVLIVDWDVHHGQGTQQAFYHDSRVLYFSIHRYEHGDFWPHLRESEFDCIGEGDGRGFNVNVPVNETGMQDQDYLHVLHNLLLPIAYEFSPDLILISAGYDAALGCPEGLMKLTPSFFAHMTHSLMGLAEGKVVAVLEGGYFIETLAESAAFTLRTLLGDPCPRLTQPLSTPSDSIKETIFNVMTALRQYWRCLQFTSPPFFKSRPLEPHPSAKYPPKMEDSKFDIMSCYPCTPKEEIVEIRKQFGLLKEATSLTVSDNHLCLVHDSLMEKHKNEADGDYPERPSRTREIMRKFEEANLLQRMLSLQARQATLRELQMIHTVEWVTTLQKLRDMEPDERSSLEGKYNSIYFNEFSTDAALCAAGSLLQVVDNVCGGQCRSGIGVIRPPGHHAEPHEPHGFCLVNNVALGATYALKKYNLKRILILDWDIHHGNGIQTIFESNPKVLYVSIHAYCYQTFFPNSPKGDSCAVGKKAGRGFNVNIPWQKTGRKDGDYLAAFFRVVLPICYEFDPELVMVSAGFDAAVNDPLGGCHISPECFGHMTHFLMSLAAGKLILALEGGYNLISISSAMAMCAKALLGDPLPSIENTIASTTSSVTINEVIDVQREFWKLLYDQAPVVIKVKSEEKSIESCQTPEFLTPTEETPFSTPRKDSISVINLSKDLEQLSVGDKLTEESVGGTTSVASEQPKVEEVQGSVGGCTDEQPKEEEVQGAAGGCTDEQPKEEEVQGAVGGCTDEQPKKEEMQGAVGGCTDEKATVILIQQMMKDQGVFAVIPLAWCPHLSTVTPVPVGGLSATAPCETCANCKENWVCLVCYQVHCSRYANGDMVRHRAATKHPIALSFSDLSVWCYECNGYLDNEILTNALRSASESKFGL